MKYCARILRPQFVFFQGHLEEATGARPSKYWFQPSDIVLGPKVRKNHHITSLFYVHLELKQSNPS